MTTLLALSLLSLAVGARDAVRAQEPQNVFLASYFRSQTTVPLFQTVISITNIHDDGCPVTIVWTSNEGEELCVTESTLPSNQTHHHCSSTNPDDTAVTMVCHAVCNAASTGSMEGHAIVQTVGRCGVRMAVDAKVYSATFTRNVDGRIIKTENIGFHHVEVYRFDGVNLTR
jgi:hypothetical protein